MISAPNTSEAATMYGDFNSLAALKTKAIQDQDAALGEVAKQFEQIFLDMMMQSMRKANDSFVDEDNPFSSSDVSFYQGMYDQQMTMELAKNNGIGLSDLIVKQLGGEVANSKKISQALKMPNSEDDIQHQIDSGKTVNEMVLNLAARRVATNSLQQVDAISQRIQFRPTNKVEVEAVNSTVVETFDSPEHFVELLMPMAEEAAQKIGVDPRVLIAQAALETGWGQHISKDSTKSSFNLFNIKATNWSGNKVSIQTTEYREGLKMTEQDDFRAYANYKESFDDYINLIQNSPRYEQALQNVENPVKYLEELQKAGYATDPKYAQKIERIFKSASVNLKDSLNKV